MPIRTLIVGGGHDRAAVYLHRESIVDRLLGGEFEAKRYGPGFRRVVVEGVIAGELDLVSAVPQQTFLARIEVKADIDTAGGQFERNTSLDFFGANNGLVILPARHVPEFGYGVVGDGRRLLLRRTPGRGDMALKLFVTGIGSG